MSAPLTSRRIHFHTKVLVPVVSFLVLLPAFTLWLVNRHISRQAHDHAHQTLATAEGVFKDSLRVRAGYLLSRYRGLVNEPRFKAVAQLADALTMSKQLDELIQETGGEADFILFTKSSGDLLAGTRRESATTLSLAELESATRTSIRKAIDGETSSGTVVVRNHQFNVISIPALGTGDAWVGAVTVGIRIGEAAVQELRSRTGADIILMAHGAVSASSLPRPELYEKFLEQFKSLTASTAARAQHGQHIRSFTASGEHFLALAGFLETASGENQDVGYLLLSSFEPALRALRSTRQTLLLVSALGVILSAIAVALAIRRITKPIRQLRDTAEIVGRGDFSRRVEVASNDECGELARAFNQMIGNLQTSRAELEKTVETLRTTQAQLVQSEKLSAVGQFVAGVTHELNNPLTSVIGFSDLLRQSDISEKHRTYLDYIVKSTQRCHKIVQGLLSFARQHPPERKLVNVNELIDGVVEIISYDMRTSNIEITRQYQPDLPQLMADPHQLQQVILNILNNARQAIQAFRPEGAIRIVTAAVNETVRIYLEDNGPGMPPEVQARVFDPFFTTKPIGKGTGLGLSLSYGIIKEHGGSISVKSQPAGGTTFCIELPVVKAPVTESKVTEPRRPLQAAAVSPAGRRVLVVDDEAWILELVREVLVTDGYEVETAPSGEQALQRLGQSTFDVIVCDWKMPGLNGLQIYEHLKQGYPDLARRMLFMTGDVINDHFQDFLKNNNRTCLPKPFSLQDFRSAMANILSTN